MNANFCQKVLPTWAILSSRNRYFLPKDFFFPFMPKNCNLIICLFKYQVLVQQIQKSENSKLKLLEYLSVILFTRYNLNNSEIWGVSGNLSKTHCKSKGRKCKWKKCLISELFCPLMNSILFISHIDSEYLVSTCSKKVPWHWSKSE